MAKKRWWIPVLCLMAVGLFLLVVWHSRQEKLPRQENYLIGSTAGGAFTEEDLAVYAGGSWKNLSQDGATVADCRKLVQTLLRQESGIKRIFLILELGGVPAAREQMAEEAQPTGERAAYLAAHQQAFAAGESPALADPDGYAAAVTDIRRLCTQRDVELTVIVAPAYESLWSAEEESRLTELFRALARTGDYWNFAVTRVSSDPRYFLSAQRPRIATARMVLARIFDDTACCLPEQFGFYCAQGTEVTAAQWKQNESREAYTQTIPVLMYHHLSDTEPENGTVISSERFRRQMELLQREGYQPVSVAALRAFVQQGVPLPEHPVLLTFDDGYLSNYELAYPILQEFGFPAVIFAIGCSVGHTRYYKETSYTLTPHFGEAEIRKMLASGLMEIQSHTFDMHQWPPYESGEAVRVSLMPLEGESRESYLNAVVQDAGKERELLRRCGVEDCFAIAFPGGAYVPLTHEAVQQAGYQVSFTTEAQKINVLVQGVPQSLTGLGRINMDPSLTEEALLDYLRREGR